MPNTIACVDREGRSGQFDVKTHYEPLGGKWRYAVRPVESDATGEAFELSVVEAEEGAVKVVMMHNHNLAHLSAKGIPDALIPFIAKELGCRVYSSKRSTGTAEFRTQEATKVWERLVKRGGAVYDAELDTFHTI